MKLFEMKRTDDLILTKHNGVSIPKRYSGAHDEYFAVRNSALMVDYSHYGIIKVHGSDAWQLLNYLVSADVSSIRDAQLLYTLFLDNNGEIVSDAYIACDDECYILISEWMSSEQLFKLVNDVFINEISRGKNYQIDNIVSLSSEWRLICVEGPYSWEVLSEIFGMDIIGLPFHEYMYIDDVIVMRTGKHGEYCYLILGEEIKLAEIWKRVYQLSNKYDLKIGGVGYLQDVRLENPCWEPNIYNPFTRCPIELQLQWAISYDKDEFIGQDAIKKRSDLGVSKRIVGAKIKDSKGIGISFGDRVFYRNEDIGVVVNIGISHTLKYYVARIYLKYEYSYVGINSYIIRTKNGDVKLITSGTPFINNLSSVIRSTENSYFD